MPERTVGRYPVERLLGSGGFAVVWLARDESLDLPVAIKVLAENWAQRTDVRDRFLAEARMLRQASSPHVVAVHDIGELPDGRPYFVMELADRGTLEDRLTDAPLSPSAAVAITVEVARGVEELHRAGIVHRDVKPSNVLIASTRDGGERLLVADLGVAKSLAMASGLTMGVGSSGYMAPEQARPTIGVDVRADVYSLGALAHRLLTGRVPEENPRRLRDLAPSVPPKLDDAVLRALDREPGRRWPGAAAFADALTAAAVAPSRRRGVLAVPALLLVAALAGGAWWGLARPGRDDAGPVRVADATGTVSLVVPREWHRQVQPGGWDAGSLGLSGLHTAGVLVATDVGRWGDDAAPVDGVFAGLTSDPALPAALTRLQHPGCTDGGLHPISAGGWTGRVHRWTACAGGANAVDDAALLSPAGDRVFMQVRRVSAETAGGSTEELVSSLRVS